MIAHGKIKNKIYQFIRPLDDIFNLELLLGLFTSEARNYSNLWIGKGAKICGTLLNPSPRVLRKTYLIFCVNFVILDFRLERHGVD